MSHPTFQIFTIRFSAAAAILLTAPSLSALEVPGHTDTPMVVDAPEYHVHDPARPQPVVVAPGQTDPATCLMAPPSDAIVLFDGTNMDAWTGGPWILGDGYMEVPPRTEDESGKKVAKDLKTKQSFGDIQLHLEWRTPAEVVGESQGRGNSGVFLMDRYEVQILDSYDNITYADGSAGAVYGARPPLVNASRGPGEWQTYDIIWRVPLFDGEKLIRPATVTVLHNGVLIQDHYTLAGRTENRKAAVYTPHEPTGPIRLQDHNNPMRFRNIWVRPLEPES
ncbi:MAG: DUF1080 domain-containing protein [Opitutaceae bacterium]